MTETNATPADGRITTEQLEHVFAIGIDRPKKLNGFSPRMLTELAEAMTAFECEKEASDCYLHTAITSRPAWSWTRWRPSCTSAAR